MTLQDIVREAQALAAEERRELIKILVDTLGNPETNDSQGKQHSLMELAGLGAELWQGIDAQQYVDELRGEWDHRP
jgi:hypothetical protein